MGTFADNLARLRVAATTGALPGDVGRWALDVIGEQGPAARRIESRNDLLRQAADLVSGSRWARAKRLEEEIAALRQHPGLRERAADDGVRDLVARALKVDPELPGSRRQLLRLLEG